MYSNLDYFTFKKDVLTQPSLAPFAYKISPRDRIADIILIDGINC